MYRASRFTIREIGVQVEEDMGEQDVDRVQEEEDLVAVGRVVIRGAEDMEVVVKDTQLEDEENISRVKGVSGKEGVVMEGMGDKIRVVKHSCKSTQS
jgi:hypothetical protein